MTIRAGFLVALFLVLPFGGIAFADGAPSPQLAGNWSFKSWTYDDCSFGGVARFQPTEEPGVFTCELTARQECPSVSWTVRQSCVARRTDDRVMVTSAIEEFIEGPATDSYWPDNFVLTMHSSQRMTGSLVSHGVHPSAFTRDAGATS
ncbi:MAG: hypothetical protein AAGJ32_12440 [Pseudomonadota bacterium]